MIFRTLTTQGDWTFGSGVYGYSTEEKAVELNIKTRLLSWKGDCFFAADDWVDWLGRLDKGQEANLKNELKNVILQSFGVVAVNSIEGTLDRDSRNFTVTYNIDTIYGTNFKNTLELSIGAVPGGNL